MIISKRGNRRVFCSGRGNGIVGGGLKTPLARKMDERGGGA